MRLALLVAVALTLGAFVLVGFVAVSRGHADVAVDIYLLYAGGACLLGLVLATGRSAEPRGESPFEVAGRPRPKPPAGLPELDRLVRELSLGTQSAFDYHFRLRPVLCEIAEARLAARGRRLEDGETLLGPDAWELVRPNVPTPRDRHGPGIDPDKVRRFVEALDRI